MIESCVHVLCVIGRVALLFFSFFLFFFFFVRRVGGGGCVPQTFRKGNFVLLYAFVMYNVVYTCNFVCSGKANFYVIYTQ